MRFKVFCTTLLLAFLASVAGEAARQVANDSVADWMHRMSEALVPAESARARARLEFHELGETGVSIDMEVSRRRQPSEKHTFIEVIEPEVARGTVYEVVARGDESLERWEYLPPVRRLRRTSGSWERTSPTRTSTSRMRWSGNRAASSGSSRTTAESWCRSRATHITSTTRS
jgi:hypothetical protein